MILLRHPVVMVEVHRQRLHFVLKIKLTSFTASLVRSSCRAAGMIPSFHSLGFR